MDIEVQFKEIKEKASDIFSKNKLINCPYFNQEITLNSDGFHHLQFSNRRERNKEEQNWGLVAIVGDNNPLKIRVVLRQVGDGKIIFWSVMPAMKLTRDLTDFRRGLAKKGIEDD